MTHTYQVTGQGGEGDDTYSDRGGKGVGGGDPLISGDRPGGGGETRIQIEGGEGWKGATHRHSNSRGASWQHLGFTPKNLGGLKNNREAPGFCP